MKRISMGLLVAFTAGAAVTYGVTRARAAGIPTGSTLTYSGSLLTYGAPDNGNHQMSLSLLVHGSGTVACTSTPTTITSVNGHFTIPIPSACVPVIHANPNVDIQVTVDSTPMGLTPLQAVPYAVEADTASNAATGSILAAAVANQPPSGMISFFNATTCPAGWAALSAAQGRYLVGLASGGTLAGTAGIALSDKETRAVPVHTHAVSDPGHAHFIDSATTDDHNFSGTGAGAQQYGVSADANGYNNGNPSGLPYGVYSVGATTGVSVNNGGDYAATNLAAPYVQFLVCQKT